jgi:MraZ protein
MAFRGSFDHTLDAKNRLTIPARFRVSLADGVVLALQHDAPSACMSVWRSGDFDSYTASLLEGMHPLSEDYATINRFYNTFSHDSELDGAGRVMVPANLLETTRLGKEVVVNGAGNRLEVWGRAAWQGQSASLVQDVQRITARLGNPD